MTDMGWDANFYKTLSDTVRNVSLSDKEIYVLGNLLPMVSWETRWSGDLTGLDLDAIRGEMEFTILDEIVGGGAMSCLDVANCIDTDIAVQNSIEQSLLADGFTPNFETSLDTSPPPSLPASALTTNLLPASLDCALQPQTAMGLARAIVSELHQSTEDFFELIEYATNAAEAISMAVEHIPILGSAVSGAIEFMDWVLETMSETYLAAYNQTVEDELACMIFCHMIDGNCTLSINDLISLYETKGSIVIPPANDLEAILTFAINTPLNPDVICVAIFHYQILRFMSWGSIGGFSAAYLQSILKYNVSASDYSYQDVCDDCAVEAPTDYWRLHFDLRSGGQKGTEITQYQAPSNGKWNGNGYTYRTEPAASVLRLNAGIADFGAQYVVRAGAQRAVRRGSTGNGSSDYSNMAMFPNANYGGAGGNLYTGGSIAQDGNKVEIGGINPIGAFNTRSIRFQNSLNKATTFDGEKELRVWEIVIWGLAGVGDTKPPRSTWVGNVLPATVPELFPDYVAP